jgi:hypothetical protein
LPGAAARLAWLPPLQKGLARMYRREAITREGLFYELSDT